MRKLVYSRDKGPELVDLLNRQDEFQVLEKLVQGNTAVYILCESTWRTWGHFRRAAFCCVVPDGDDALVLSIVHLNIQKAWHGVNLFRSADRKIEDHICDYVYGCLAGGRMQDNGETA